MNSIRRLILRQWKSEDQPFFVSLNTCPVIRRHMDGAMEHNDCVRFFQEIVLKNPEAFAVCLNISPQGTDVSSCEETVIGHCFINPEAESQFPEVGYMLSREHWGKGLATELLKSLVNYAEKKYQGLSATCDLENESSLRVLEKCGFVVVKIVREEEPHYAELIRLF